MLSLCFFVRKSVQDRFWVNYSIDSFVRWFGLFVNVNLETLATFIPDLKSLVKAASRGFVANFKLFFPKQVQVIVVIKRVDTDDKL